MTTHDLGHSDPLRCWGEELKPREGERVEHLARVIPQHTDFKQIVAGSLEPVVWDARLFARRRT